MRDRNVTLIYDNPILFMSLVSGDLLIEKHFITYMIVQPYNIHSSKLDDTLTSNILFHLICQNLGQVSTYKECVYPL